MKTKLKRTPYNYLVQDFCHIAEKFCNKVSLEDYLNLSTENFVIKYKNSNNKTLSIVTEQYQKSMVRNVMIETLNNVGFKRGNKKWTTNMVIPFMQEIMDLYSQPYLNDIEFENAKKELSKKYNVPVSRLKTQMALFFINYDKGNDKYGIDKYFTHWDIFNWKYNSNSEKLAQATENDKLTEIDRQIINELYKV